VQLDHVAFDLLRRSLGAMTVRVRHMLDAATADDDDALDGIQRWGVDQWRALDRTLEQIRDALGTAVV
jgi:hypothetical protein